MPMELFLQDAIVTSIAAGAFVALVWRTIGLLRPSPEDSGCSACPGCDLPQKTAGTASTVVPLSSIRRSRS